MRFFIILTLALGFHLAGTNEAEARRGAGVSGYSEALEFVAPTGATGPDGVALSLCVLVRTQHVMFLNVWRTEKGYAVAENTCDVESFYPVDAAQLASMQATGLVSADVPSLPVTKTGLAVPIWAWLVLSVLVAIALVKIRGKMVRKSQRRALMGNASAPAMAIIDAMCHVSKADGHVSPAEVQEIAQAVEAMTGEAIELAQVEQMALLAESQLSDNDFKKFAKGHSREVREDMMRGVLFVAVADGKLDGKERQFVGKLASGLRIPRDQVSLLMHEVMASRPGGTLA